MTSQRPQKRPRIKTFNPREDLPAEEPLPDAAAAPLLLLAAEEADDDEESAKASTGGPGDMPADMYHRLILLVENDQSESWPAQTKELCRWDMQPFTSTPVGIPARYDEIRKKYCLEGYFCSFSCARAYIRTDSPANTRQLKDMWLNMLVRELCGSTAARINPAPPREKLSQLYAQLVRAGCHADPLQEATTRFRQYCQSFTLQKQPAPLVRVTHLVEERRTHRVKQEEHAKKLELMRQQPKPMALTQRGMQEQLKHVIKRSQPLARGRVGIEAMMKVERKRPNKNL